VLGLVFPYQANSLAREHLQNDLFCVKWVTVTQSIKRGLHWDNSLSYDGGLVH